MPPSWAAKGAEISALDSSMTGTQESSADSSRRTRQKKVEVQSSQERKRKDGKSGPKKQAEVTQLLVKSCLQNFQRIRSLVAACMITYRLKADSKEAVGIAQSLKGYASDAKAKGPSHGLGPPHLYVWMGLITALLERGVAVGMKMRRC